MKKILLALSFMLILGLVGCSSGSEYKNVPVSIIKKAIESSNLLTEETSSVDIVDLDYFNDIEDKILEGFVIRAENRLSLEDIIVIKSESKDIDIVYDNLLSYKKNMIVNTFDSESNSKDSATIADNTIIEKKGNYTYLISAKNAKEIEGKILNLIKK